MGTYDEAIKDVEEVIHIEGTCSKFIRIRKALIYAKKEHELLRLHIKLTYYAKYDGYDIETKERVLELKDEITKLKKELEEVKV